MQDAISGRLEKDCQLRDPRSFVVTLPPALGSNIRTVFAPANV